MLAGPSGCGKSRLAERSGLPVVALDDFYREGADPAMPRLGGPDGPIDWEDPRSWDHDAAVAALEQLCRTGTVEVPLYSFAEDRRVGTHTISLDGADRVIAEGIFAAEVVDRLRECGVLHSAWCVHHRPSVTFVRRLARDLKERRKPPATLVRRGLALMRAEPEIVRRQTALGAQPARAKHLERDLVTVAEPVG